MTPFEIFAIILLAIIAVLEVGVAYKRITTMKDNKTDKRLEYIKNTMVDIEGLLSDISQQLDNIDGNVLDDLKNIITNNREDFKEIQDLLDKMHRNICADVAEKMVDKAFPIKEGESPDRPFDNGVGINASFPWAQCYLPNGNCPNPQRDCINCPRRGEAGNWTTTSNKVETTNNCKVKVKSKRCEFTDDELMQRISDNNDK